LAAACAGAAGLAGKQRVAFAAATADLGGDPACGEFGAEWVAAVAAVGPDLARPVTARVERVDERQQVRAFVLVAGSEPHLERPALPVDGEVILAGGKAAVDRARPG